MVTRIITALIALAIFFVVILAGEIPLQIAIGIVILAMLYEAYSAITKSKCVKAVGFIGSLVLMAGIYFDMFMTSAVVMIILFMGILVVLHGKNDYREIFATAFMTLYVTLFMSFIPKLMIEAGLGFMALIFIIAWGSDTAAYFCGTFLGKHKLIPRVSPKKTVEGSVGALVCVMILCMLYMFIMNVCGYPLGGIIPAFGDYARIGLLGIVTAALSQLGDLTASAIKRDTGIKDYGKIFPGHGGFMDRFDSVIFIAPIVYYFCVNIIL